MIINYLNKKTQDANLSLTIKNPNPLLKNGFWILKLGGFGFGLPTLFLTNVFYDKCTFMKNVLLWQMYLNDKCNLCQMYLMTNVLCDKCTLWQMYLYDKCSFIINIFITNIPL